mmetsp:Transcript_30131/g.61156  ORF Transcript_30131/g.61156 Transcript_30131/m.61156 type:complete len:101 (+) Transcript_30131:959-1261(+)
MPGSLDLPKGTDGERRREQHCETDLSLNIDRLGGHERACRDRHAFVVGICHYLSSNNLRKFRLDHHVLLGGTKYFLPSFLVNALGSATKLKSLTLVINPY